MAGRTAYYGGIVLDGIVFHIDAAKQESYSKRGIRYMQNGDSNLLIDFADTSKSPSTQNATGSIVNGATFSNFAPYHLATHTTTYWHDTTRPEWKSSAGIGTFYGNIEFDGINDYVMFGNTPEITGITDITVSAWFYVNKFKSGVSMITSRYNNISTNNGWELYYDNQGVIYFGGRESNAAYIYVTSSMTVDSGSFNYSGNIDSSFVYGTGFNLAVRTMTVQSDGKILVGGDFTNYQSVYAGKVIRLNADGSKDNSFVFGTGFNSDVLGISVQSDGKILVVGGFTTYNNTSASCIIRLNANGSVDSTFVSGSGFTNSVNCVAIQSDGKILVGGPFQTYNGISANGIIRLNSDGTKDTSFVYGTGFIKIGSTAGLRQIKLQSDGKILCIGSADTYNGTTSMNNIIRLNSDGSVDTSFVYGTGFVKNIVSPYPIRLICVEVQVNGKILVGGDFTTYNGTTAKNIIRLNSDGSVDTSFVYGTGAFNAVSGGVYSIAIQGDGKIILVGIFTDYNGTAVNHIIRLNSDGSVDAPFISSTGGGFGTPSQAVIYNVSIGIGGNILAAGAFVTYNGTSARCIVSLISSTNCRNGGWYNAVGTKRGNNWSIYLAETNKYVVDSDISYISYVDSTIPVLQGSINAGTGTASFQTNNLYIGMDPTSSLNMDGRLMSLSIYNKALSVSEINQNYKSMSKRIFKLLTTEVVVITEFITLWKTDNAGTSGSNQITIPIGGSSYNYSVDWGDSTTSTGVTTAITHTYTTAGTYTVKISGLFPTIRFASGGDRLKLLEVSNWGSNVWQSMVNSFYGCENLRITATDAPDLSTVTNLSRMFNNCIIMDDTIGHWNTANVTDMYSMFMGATNFNQDISGWNTANVTNMAYMFQGATNFNQPIGAWNTANVIDMSSMFSYTNFNQLIGTWNTISVTDMSYMFHASSFNQPIGTWNTISVTNINNMFSYMSTFNQPIGTWNTMNVTNMKAMFLYSTAFDKDISEWNVSSVIDMSQMFKGATSFNCGGGGAPTTPHQVPNPYESETNVLLWKTSALTNTKEMFSDASSFNIPLYLYMDLVTDMSFMFQGATSFNQNLEENYGYWVTSGALNMRYMFYGATSFANGGIAWMAWQTNNVTNMSAMFFNTPLFNADITSWTTNNVTNMDSMFYQAAAFNQNIGVWNISNVVNFSNFMGTKTPLTLSTTNLNGIYNGWASRPVKPNINISFGSAKRTAASTATKLVLTSAPNNWSIADGGI